MEYAHYHAGLAKLDQQGGDILNEVLLSLLGKDPKLLEKLYRKKGKGGYREIDFYILRMIKLNCHSETSPYRFRYKVPKRDENADIPRMEEDSEISSEVYYEDQELEDPAEDSYQEWDPTELICAHFQVIRNVLEKLPVPEREKEIFRHKALHDNSWKEWKGKEKTRQLQTIFKKVKCLVIEKINGLKLSYSRHIARSSYQIEKIKNEYRNTLFPAAFRYSKRYKRALIIKEKYELLLNQITGIKND